MAAKKPMKQQRYRGGMLARILTVVAAAVAVVVGVMIFFKVHTITVAGNARYGTEEIILASGISEGENLMTLNKATAAQSIMLQLPYIESVRITRQLPDTVVITVSECESVAVVTDASGAQWFLSATGKVVEQVTAQTQTDPAGLITVEGLLAVEPAVGQPLQTEQPEQAQALAQLLQALSDTSLLDGVRSVNLEKVYDITLRYEERFDVLLGGTDQIDYKIHYLEEIICNQLDAGKTGTLDLTLEEEGVARLIPW